MIIKNCKECPFCVSGAMYPELDTKSCKLLPFGFMGYNYHKEILSDCPLKNGEIVVKLDERMK